MMTLISEATTSVITNVTTAVIATAAPVERSSSSSFSRPAYVNITAVRIYVCMLHTYTTHATYFTNAGGRYSCVYIIIQCSSSACTLCKDHEGSLLFTRIHQPESGFSITT